MDKTTTLARIRFFEKTVRHKNWKEQMSGENEKKVIEVLEACGFKNEKDFVRQHPIGERFVIDFAFINEQIALEVDGASHNTKKQRKLDDMRDSFLRTNGWVAIRIKDKELFGYKLSFYKSLIKEIVEERREQWNNGELFEIDIPNFNLKDYE